MGKTREAEAAAVALRAAEELVSPVQLGRRADLIQTLLDLLESPAGVAWREHGRRWHIFLDGVDEAPGGSAGVEGPLQRFLEAAISSGGPLASLRLRLLCRTVDWSPVLERVLNLVWPDSEIRKLQITPLSTEDVRQALDVATGDSAQAQRFIEATVGSNAQALTTRPVSLRLLTDLYRERNELPPRQADLYLLGLQTLVEEPDPAARSRVRRGAVGGPEKLTVAARIAAVSTFSGLPRVWVGTPGAGPLGSFPLQDIAGGYERAPPFSFRVSEGDVLEVLRTPLFEAVAPDLYGWSHQTFAEFLAARYVLEHGLTAEETFGLLAVSEPGRGGVVAPQLREVAAWVATQSNEMFEHLLDVEPDILLQSDVAATDPAQRERLVDALLKRVNEGEILEGYFGLVHLFDRLAHGRLSGQLWAFINDPGKTEFARRAAIDIAEATHLHDLAAPLALIALSPQESPLMRKDAAYAVSKLGDPRAKASLAGVLAQDLGADADDELKGAVLSTVWPDHLTVPELLRVLAPRRVSNLIGHYALFERRLAFPNLSPSDALAAISWLTVQLPASPDDYSWRGVLSKVFWAASSRIDDADVRKALAHFIAGSFDDAGSWIYDGDPTDADDGGVPAWGGAAEDRLALMRDLLRGAAEPAHMARLAPHFVARLVEPGDLELYLAALRGEADVAQQAALAEIIADLTRQLQLDDLSAVWTFAETHSVLEEALLAHYYVPLDSQVATWMRDGHRRAVEREERQARVSADAARADAVLQDILRDIEAGSAEPWWRLNLQLFVSNAGRYEGEYEFRSDLKATPGWGRLSATDRLRLVAVAERYLREARLGSLRWLGTNTQHRPAAAAVRAFRLLADERPEAIAALPAEVWARWAPALISFFDNDANSAADALGPLAQLSYAHAPEAVMRTFARMALSPTSEGLPQRPLDLIEPAVDERLADFLDELRRRPGRRATGDPHLFAFLVRAGRMETVRALLAALTAPDPLKALAREGPVEEATRAASELLRSGNQDAWQALLGLRARAPDLARSIWSNLAQQIGFQRSGAAFDGPEATLAQSYLDLEALFPNQPQETGRARFLSAADYVERLQSSLIGQLVGRGTAAAVRALEQIAEVSPAGDSIRWRIQEARRNYRAAARPLRSPAELIAMIGAFRPALPLRDEAPVQTADAPPQADVGADARLDQEVGPTLPPASKIGAGADGGGRGRVLKILSVATEWNSANGGVSTLNRELCIALAALGHDVRCVVWDATDQERSAAEALGVILIRSPSGVGVPEAQRLLLMRKRHLDGFIADVVLGHDHVTGPAALQLALDLPATYIHMLHTVPEEAEGLKGRSAGPGRALLRGDDKANDQVALSRAAQAVIAIGPKIHSAIALRLSRESRVVEMTPGLNVELLKHEPDASRLPRSYGLMSARMLDADLKGTRLACQCFKKAGLDNPWPTGSRPHLVLRGFTKDVAMEEFTNAVGPFDEFNEWVQPRAYTEDVSEVQAEIQMASVVLMPSRVEGFGLAGFEAIAAGVPVVISMESGLAEYLSRAVANGDLDTATFQACVADVVGNPQTIMEDWAAKVGSVLMDRPAAFRRAATLRAALKSKLSWRAAAESFTATALDALA